MRKQYRFFRKAIFHIYASAKSSHSIQVGSFELTFDTSDQQSKDWFFPRYTFGRYHEPAVTELVIEELGPADIFFDLGSNLGWFTVLACQITSEGEVHSFDVDPRLNYLLLKSVARHSQISAKHIMNTAAIGETTGKFGQVVPHQAGNLSTNQVLDAAYNAAGGARSVAISIDDYCEECQQSPDFIKMDIEGAETEAILGMKETLLRKRPKLLLEVHPALIREKGWEPKALIDEVLDVVPEYEVWRKRDYRQGNDASIWDFGIGSDWTDRPEVLFFKCPEEREKLATSD